MTIVTTRVVYIYLALLLGCALAGLAGAVLSVEQLKFFAPGVTAGRGWIAIAIVIVGGWRPWGVVLAALLFGVTDMLQFQVQGQSAIPYELLLALPYVVAIVALAIRRKSVRAPRDLGVTYRKRERIYLHSDSCEAIEYEEPFIVG